MEASDKAARHELGDFMSTVCFKAAVVGLEEALGEKAAAIALIAAGRQRGKQLAQTFNLVGQGAVLSLEEVRTKLDFAVGKGGTCLCLIDKIERDGEAINVYTRETVCSAGEPEGSPRHCTYTLGALQGFLEAVMGIRMRGQHTGSVLRGGHHDVLTYRPLI